MVEVHLLRRLLQQPAEAPFRQVLHHPDELLPPVRQEPVIVGPHPHGRHVPEHIGPSLVCRPLEAFLYALRIQVPGPPPEVARVPFVVPLACLHVIDVAQVPAPGPLVQHAADRLMEAHRPEEAALPVDRHHEMPLDPPLPVQAVHQGQARLQPDAPPALLHPQQLAAQRAGRLPPVLHAGSRFRLREDAAAGRAAEVSGPLLPDGIMQAPGCLLLDPIIYCLPWAGHAFHQLADPLDASLLLPVPAAPRIFPLQGRDPLIEVGWPVHLDGAQRQLPVPFRDGEPFLGKEAPDIIYEGQVLRRPLAIHAVGGVLPGLRVRHMPMDPCPIGPQVQDQAPAGELCRHPPPQGAAPHPVRRLGLHLLNLLPSHPCLLPRCRPPPAGRP